MKSDVLSKGPSQEISKGFVSRKAFARNLESFCIVQAAQTHQLTSVTSCDIFMGVFLLIKKEDTAQKMNLLTDIWKPVSCVKQKIECISKN